MYLVFTHEDVPLVELRTWYLLMRMSLWWSYVPGIYSRGCTSGGVTYLVFTHEDVPLVELCTWYLLMRMYL